MGERGGKAVSFGMNMVVAGQPRGAGRGPGTGSARFGDTVNTYAKLASVPRVSAT